jgi:hypothetical protein
VRREVPYQIDPYFYFNVGYNEGLAREHEISGSFIKDSGHSGTAISKSLHV